MWWNQKELPQPPNNTYKSFTEDLDLTKLRNALQDGVTHFQNNDFLANEAAILSRILYRMKTKFRSSKDFKLMEKLSRSLNIYFDTNMSRHLKNVLDMTPKRYLKDTYLPTRNMFSYILVRLQGLVKLMERIYDTCLLVASDLNHRFYIGHFWKLFLILFALVSRISILIKVNTKFLCELYGKLLPHSFKLQNTGKNWLPKGYELPSDLRTWLSVQWVYEEEFVDLTFEPANEILNYFNLVDDDDDDVLFCDEYILLDDEDKKIAFDFNKLSPIIETFTRNRMRGFSINEDDIGEEITDIIELNDTASELKTKKKLTGAVADESCFIYEGEEDDAINSDASGDNEDDIGEEIADIIELNDTASELNTIKKCLNFNVLNKNNQLEDIEEELSLSGSHETSVYVNNKKVTSPTNRSCFIYEGEEDDAINSDASNNEQDDNGVIINLANTLLETPIREQHNLTNNNEIIILNDTISNGSQLTTQSKKKKRNKKSLKENRKSSSQGQDEILQKKNTKVPRKRKLKFDDVISNKKSKKVVEPLKSNEILLDLQTKIQPIKKSKQKKQKQIDKNKKKVQANISTNDLNADSSIIFLDQVLPLSKNTSKTEAINVSFQKEPPKIKLDSPAKDRSTKKKKTLEKRKQKQAIKNDKVNKVRATTLEKQLGINSSVVFLDQDFSLTEESNQISQEPGEPIETVSNLPVKGQLSRKGKKKTQKQSKKIKMGVELFEVKTFNNNKLATDPNLKSLGPSQDVRNKLTKTNRKNTSKPLKEKGTHTHISSIFNKSVEVRKNTFANERLKILKKKLKKCRSKKKKDILQNQIEEYTPILHRF